MFNAPAVDSFRAVLHSRSFAEAIVARGRNLRCAHLFLAAAILLSPLAIAQSVPSVTGVDPASGKVNDPVTVAGSDLGKGSVSAVFLSDDKDDFKATIVEQTAEKIVMKVPNVKAGDYNISVQVGDKLYIKPIKFKVE